jgi:hypothetical protein
MQSRHPVIAILGAALLLGGCFDLDDDDSKSAAVGTPNQPPTISGSPTVSVVAGEAYDFLPIASDPDGDRLEFSVARKPAWASFDKTTGRLWGTPDTEDVGNFTNITISVSDGNALASLTAFDVTVDQIALGSATLSWMPPTENADGSVLTDLAGYRIYYGRDRDSLSRIVVLSNPGLASYVVENLAPAVWYFAMTSVNAEGVESQRTPTISKTIS